ncbi:MAG: septum formation initiator family protein [Blautia sp.]|nr:septum formation initiator family protein [Blautia sp.]MDY3997563.1 septum formation initiator family protein [Blautia sp.]
MKELKKGNGKKITNNRLGMAAIGCVAVMLLGVTVSQSRNLEKRLAYYDERVAALEESIEQEQARTEEIKDKKEYMQTDEYVEEVARNRLGLVKDNEIVFEEAK